MSITVTKPAQAVKIVDISRIRHFDTFPAFEDELPLDDAVNEINVIMGI